MITVRIVYFLFFITIGTINTSTLKDIDLINELLVRVNNLNWYEKKAIKIMDSKTLKNIVLFADEEIEDFLTEKRKLEKENYDNQMIFLFQTHKDIKSKIKILDQVIEKYLQQEDKLDKVIDFLKLLRDDYKKEFKKEINRIEEKF